MLGGFSHLLGWVYNGLGAIRIKQKNWKEAYLYMKKAEGVAEKSVNPELKKTVYATINDYYEGIGDDENAALYAKKYLKAFSEANGKNGEVPGNGEEIMINKSGRQISIAKNVIIIVLCSALIGSFLHFRTKQRKQLAKLRHILRSQRKIASKPVEVSVKHEESSFTNVSVEKIFENSEEVGKKRSESLMTPETETKLLELLDDFEKGSLYNNKNMSLPFLAGELSTNTKYLSYVINQHKSSDFKTYINRLRINYIVDKLINDDKYRQYKISILADECGFSTHSKFASVFKIVTDYSPSAYIKLLDSDRRSDKYAGFRENKHQ
ncbi:helix-turn-helix domain-containing protein [Chryseobacterium arachidis]